MTRLFAPEELQLRRSGLARLRELAARPQPAVTSRERMRAEDRAAIDRLREQGRSLAARFGLRYRAVEPERDGVVAHYGICYEDGLIRIRLRHAKTGRPLKESSLVDTLCHELAHLRHFDHGKRFRRLYARILAEARHRGYYRPGPIDRRPRQGSLFEVGRCGTAAGRSVASKRA